MYEITINSSKLIYDKEKTKTYQSNFNPCNCQGCRNYFENIKANTKLCDFLKGFGLNPFRPDEVIYFSLDEQQDSLIFYEVYYGIYGKISGVEISFKEYGVNISFKRSVNILTETSSDYFWLVINKNYPYILKEERDI